jgi:DNA-binding NtrC family response regulator
MTMTQASVLIVDDEPFARQTLSEWFRRMNFRVIEADGGRQAMERIRKDEPDIIVSDMVMPGMDGLQLLEESKTIRADVPFLMVTGYPSPSAAVNAIKHGASDYLAKPFTPEELTRRVNRSLLQKSAGSAFATARGMALGAALSAMLWVLVIGAIATMLY